MDLIETKNIWLNSSLEKHKKELDASIRYASYIQKAMLPSKNDINRLFPNNLLVYLPRDIVSGDFYWVGRQKNRFIFTAADCTGHGVPGAFMSILGISILNQIVLGNKNISAGSILELLREHVMKSLHQTGTIGEQQDGMDIALGIIDTETHTLQFAGAYNPLYLVRSGSLTQLDADRMPIGIDPLEERPFTNREILLDDDDMIYVFSDGFADQFGGPEEKKFKQKGFKELLTEASKFSVSDQQNFITQRFMDWKENTNQMDDVLIFGIRYKK